MSDHPSATEAGEAEIPASPPPAMPVTEVITPPKTSAPAGLAVLDELIEPLPAGAAAPALAEGTEVASPAGANYRILRSAEQDRGTQLYSAEAGDGAVLHLRIGSGPAAAHLQREAE